MWVFTPPSRKKTTLHEILWDRTVLHNSQRSQKTPRSGVVELDQGVLSHRNCPHHFRWLRKYKTCLSVNLVFHKNRVFVQFVFLPESIFGTNFATVNVLFASVQGVLSVHLKESSERAVTPWPESRVFARG